VPVSPSTPKSSVPRVLLVLTGGRLPGKPFVESVVMNKYLEETHASVKEWQQEGRLEIIQEKVSQNTADSKILLVKRLKKIVEVVNEQAGGSATTAAAGSTAGNLERYLVGCTVITSDFHMPRSCLIFNQVFNAVFDLSNERQGLRQQRRELAKSGLWPPPVSQFLFDLSFVGPPVPREHSNQNEPGYIKGCPEYLAKYESRFPTGDPSAPPAAS